MVVEGQELAAVSFCADSDNAGDLTGTPCALGSRPVRSFECVMYFHTLLKLKVLVSSLAALVTCVPLVVPGYSPGRAPPLYPRGNPCLHVGSAVAMSSCASPAVSSATDAPRDAWQAVEGLAKVSPRYDAFLIGESWLSGKREQLGRPTPIESQLLCR